MNQTVNTRTAAVIDPILSTHARGYRNAEFDLLFPRVTVPNRAMRVLKFGKESFRMMATRRAPGAEKKRVQYGYASDPISLVQDALEGVVPVEHQEEATKIPGIDLASGAINMIMDVIDLGLEYDIAQLVRAPGSYSVNNQVALAGTSRWTDPASDPSGDMKAAKEAIRSMIGRYPNVLTLGPSAFNALSEHPKIIERFKYTSSDSITTKMLANFFDVEEVIVGKAVYLPETAGEDQPAIDIWGDDAVLAYVPRQNATYQAPAFGYTYELNGYPQVHKPYFWEPNDSWIYPFKVERRPYLVGAEGGFLFQNAGAQ